MASLGEVCRRSVDALLSVLLAPQCASCGARLDFPLDGPVCGECWAAILPLTPPLCVRCGDPLPTWRESRSPRLCRRCRRSPPAFDAARAIGAYDGSLREIIQAFKYQGRRSLAAPLAARMALRGAAVLADADWIVPVPLHPARRRERGFNQAADLARNLGARRVCHALTRIKRTRTQTDLSDAERHRNVHGAFALSPAARMRMPGAIVVVIDDVNTTGATLDACARVLKDAGVREVRALTAARVVSPPLQTPHRR